MTFLGLFGSTSPDLASQTLVDAVAADELARATGIARRWRYYHGLHPRPLRVRPGEVDDNVIVNYCRLIVDKGVSWLVGKDIRFELDETAETPAEEWLEACWQANRQALLLHNLALTGAVAGHAFVKIVPGQPYPRLVVLDPASVTVRWLPDDLGTVVAYRVRYPALDPQLGKAVTVRQRIERQDDGTWLVTDERSVEGGPFATVRQVRWGYPWPPIVECQNLPYPNDYWGLSDLEDDVLALNDGINFHRSNIARILRYHAHPKTWGKGFTAQHLNVAVDETIVLPSPDAELRNLEMQSDLASSLQAVRALEERLHEVSRVPEVATGKLESAGNLSGVALQILYQPLIEKTETKRLLYGDLLVELNRRLLALGGFGEDNRVTLHWPELLPSDPLQERQALLIDQQLGVSQDTLLQKLGYDPDLERQKREAGSAQLGDQLLAAFAKGQ
jgi:hypothetical protein